MTAHHIDRAIEALARRQHGVFNRTQALDLGASSSFIDRRLASGRWLRLASSVYALPGNPATFQRQCAAATLAERLAWISGRTAAALHGLDGFRPGRIEITVPVGANHRNPLAVVRRREDFQSTRIDNIPVGTIEQTICDLTSRLDAAALEDVVDLALSSAQTTVSRMLSRLESAPARTRDRLGALGRMLELRSNAAYVPPTSKLEGALYRVLDHPSLPNYERQAAFPWRPGSAQRADALIAAWRLFPEADGRAWHTRVADFERDRRRDRDALAHGYDVARFAYDELVNCPRSVVEDLLRIGEARCA